MLLSVIFSSIVPCLYSQKAPGMTLICSWGLSALPKGTLLREENCRLFTDFLRLSTDLYQQPSRH